MAVSRAAAEVPMSSRHPTAERPAPVTRAVRRFRTAELFAELHGTEQLDDRRIDTIRDELVLTNSQVALALARRFRGRGVDLDDLEQVAYVALVRAVQRYDATRSADFMLYAVPTIVGELKRHFRDHGWTIRVPRGIQETQRRLDGEPSAPAVGERYDDARLEKLADLIGADPRQVGAALAARGCFTPASLDVRVGSGENGRLAELIPANDTGLDAVDARLMVERLWSGIPVRDRRVLHLRYFEERSQSEIGQDLGVSQVQVSRLLARIHRDLRRRLEPAVAVAVAK
jgi:RNA polymerase sigma-B factor